MPSMTINVFPDGTIGNFRYDADDSTPVRLMVFPKALKPFVYDWMHKKYTDDGLIICRYNEALYTVLSLCSKFVRVFDSTEVEAIEMGL